MTDQLYIDLMTGKAHQPKSKTATRRNPKLRQLEAEGWAIEKDPDGWVLFKGRIEHGYNSLGDMAHDAELFLLSDSREANE
jgi:hypothetical protein